MTTFRTVENGIPADGRLVYDEAGFDTLPRPTGCIASVSVHEVELMLAEEDQRVVFVTGYCPHQSWREEPLKRPNMRRGLLYAVVDGELTPGTTMGLHARDESWPILFDAGSGWVRIGKGDPKRDADAILFAPGAAAVLENGRLVALWLHPERIPSTPVYSPPVAK